jgi:hypothetical protein
MGHAQPPAERPTVKHTVDAEVFPFTIQVHDERTGELLWEHICHGPEEIEVPGFYPHPVSVTVINANGERSTMFSTGVES